MYKDIIIHCLFSLGCITENFCPLIKDDRLQALIELQKAAAENKDAQTQELWNVMVTYAERRSVGYLTEISCTTQKPYLGDLDWFILSYPQIKTLKKYSQKEFSPSQQLAKRIYGDDGSFLFPYKVDRLMTLAYLSVINAVGVCCWMAYKKISAACPSTTGKNEKQPLE